MVKGTGAEFVAAKLKERDERHARAGASRFMVEPNVKEGKGGLRDLHTLFWIAHYLHPADSLDQVLKLDMFQGREVRAFIRAFDFLEAVRAHLHFATGRPEERLSFDLQPEIARRMGYADRARRRRQHPGGRALHAPLFPDRPRGRRADPGVLRQAGGRAPEGGAARACRASCPRRAAAAPGRWPSPASTSTAAG